MAAPLIRAVIFDFDGLILETEGPALESWSEIYREHGHEVPMQMWHGFIGSDRGFEPADYLAALVGEGFDRAAMQRRRDLRKTELIAALDVMEGVRDYIADARRLGLRIGIASSSSRGWVMGHLERLRIHALWDAVLTSDDVEKTKPSPDLYVAAVNALGVAPDQAVALEDSPNGIAAAKDAGLRCVAVPNALTRDLDVSRADVRLGSLAEMPLERLLAVLSAA
ncbi:MAG TPA: HAD family hydrolase [Candidatus Limnocylindrales bacterium]|nr:HAD family hydrolase [Candidatus Limnocylindrales bacterium]